MIASSIAWTETVRDAGICSDAWLVPFEPPLRSADFSEGGEDSVKEGAWLSDEAALNTVVSDKAGLRAA